MQLRHLWIPLALTGMYFGACAAKDDNGGAAINHDAIASDVATVVCDAFSSCDCKSGLQDPDDCNDSVTPALARAISDGERLGLRYYGECLGKARKYVDALGCDKANEVEGDDELAQLLYDTRACKLLAGDAGPGDVCTTAASLGFLTVGDSCAPGLVCADTCVKLPTDIGDLCAVGQLCPPSSTCLDPDADGVTTCEKPAKKGKACNPHDTDACGTDLVCDPMALECAELPGAGQPCPANVCKQGNACNPLTVVCDAYPSLGQPCDVVPFCNEGAYCDFNTATCIALPAKDEMCPTGECADGFVCGPAGICIDTPAVACALPEAVGFCLYRFDGICDEPKGTGLCKQGTDPEDCVTMLCPTELNGLCDEPGGNGSGLCPPGSDEFDCMGMPGTGSESGSGGSDSGESSIGPGDESSSEGGNPDCPPPLYGDGDCDEPEGSNLCPDGTDPLDCP